MKFFVFLSLFFVSNVAMSTPSYLTCNVGSNNIEIKFTVDENQFKVIEDIPSTGLIRVYDAHFSEDSIVFVDGYMRYTIGRQDLMLHRDSDNSAIKSDTGTCEVKQIPFRKI